MSCPTCLSRGRRIHLSLALVLILIVVVGCGGNYKSFAPGMSHGQATSMLRKLSGKSGARLTESISSLPLGLDFYAGARLFTVDTDIMLNKAVGYPALYFYDGKVIAVRTELHSFRDFLELKSRFPTGRYFMHKFPDEKRFIRVFEAVTDKHYVFTDQRNTLFVFDNAARQQVMAKVRGSYCWHVKLFSPQLRPYIDEYTACVKNEGIGRSQLEQDLKSCLEYCDNVPDYLSSPMCKPICEEAYQFALPLAARNDIWNVGPEMCLAP